jgi:hypothetical protein
MRTRNLPLLARAPNRDHAELPLDPIDGNPGRLEECHSRHLGIVNQGMVDVAVGVPQVASPDHQRRRRSGASHDARKQGAAPHTIHVTSVHGSRFTDGYSLGELLPPAKVLLLREPHRPRRCAQQVGFLGNASKATSDGFEILLHRRCLLDVGPENLVRDLACCEVTRWRKCSVAVELLLELE